jgi:L-threonylcarbamoyladenylate synthase
LTELLKIDPRAFSLAELRPAVGALLGGGVVAAATESFYALMVMADRGPALDGLYYLKFGREPDFCWSATDDLKSENPFLLLLDSRERIKAYAQEVPREAYHLMDTFWPGLLTIILKSQTGLHPAILGKKKSSIALRVDRHPVPGALARMSDRGVTGTSATPHGSPPAATAGEVLDYFQGRLDVVVDSGPAGGRRGPGGAALPSTIVDMTKEPFHIVREGAIDGKEVLSALSFPIKD